MLQIKFDGDRFASGRPAFRITCDVTGKHAYAKTRKEAQSITEAYGDEFDDTIVMLLDESKRLLAEIRKRHPEGVITWKHKPGSDGGVIWLENDTKIGIFWVDWGEPEVAIKLF